MRTENQSTVTEFILLGLTSDPLVQMVLFPFLLFVYMATMAGNLFLIVIVRTDKRLHNSMYFFLANLSFLDICYSSAIVPKMLVDFFSLRKTISFSGCAIQVFFSLLMGETECILLALMAYDRYVAICRPLHYNMIMSTRVCFWMVGTSWITSLIITSIDLYVTFSLIFCGPNVINHFFCEAPLIVQLSCSDITLSKIVKLMGTVMLSFVPLLLILISYLRIIFAILKISSGKYMVFSTCVSHLVVVVIFYGTGMFMYVKPEHAVAENTDKKVAVFYTVITPMLNPMIYSLRNKDVHRAMKRLLVSQ
ncbi:LOW QUALITY PROTEIN: olfactory receptor 5AR1-like [Gastrophryne carolinensis]